MITNVEESRPICETTFVPFGTNNDTILTASSKDRHHCREDRVWFYQLLSQLRQSPFLHLWATQSKAVYFYVTYLFPLLRVSEASIHPSSTQYSAEKTSNMHPFSCHFYLFSSSGSSFLQKVTSIMLGPFISVATFCVWKRGFIYSVYFENNISGFEADLTDYVFKWVRRLEL